MLGGHPKKRSRNYSRVSCSTARSPCSARLSLVPSRATALILASLGLLQHGHLALPGQLIPPEQPLLLSSNTSHCSQFFFLSAKPTSSFPPPAERQTGPVLASVPAGCSDLPGEEGRASGTILQPRGVGPPLTRPRTPRFHFPPLRKGLQHASCPFLCPEPLQICREQSRGGPTEPGEAEHRALPASAQQDEGRGCSRPRAVLTSQLPLQHTWFFLQKPAEHPQHHLSPRASRGHRDRAMEPLQPPQPGSGSWSSHLSVSELQSEQHSELQTTLQEGFGNTSRLHPSLCFEQEKKTQTPNQETFLTARKIKASTSCIIPGVRSRPRFRKLAQMGKQKKLQLFSIRASSRSSSCRSSFAAPGAARPRNQPLAKLMGAG